MATKQAVLPVATAQSAARKASAFARFLIKYFYFCMSLLIAVVVIYGFSHTVDQNLVHATPPRPWILWLHGAVFSGWLAFFIFQSALVRTGNVKLHRLTGWFGAALGVLIPVLGISTAIVMHRFLIAHFHAATVRLPPTPANNTFFSVQALEMVLFAFFFGWRFIGARSPSIIGGWC